MQFQQVEAIVHREIVSGITQVEGIEAGLRLFQGYLHFAGLQNLMRMIGRETERHATVYDVLAKTEGEIYCTFFGLFITDGVIVERTCHAGHTGVITVAILVADYLLQDDSHLLLIDDITCGLHIRLAVAEIDRSIYAFDGVGQHTEHFVFIIQIRNHISIIDSGEGLIVRILQQGRRADGKR